LDSDLKFEMLLVKSLIPESLNSVL
jgi:hypothetical protein